MVQEPMFDKFNVSKRIPIGLLGATGVVGQRFILLLSNHPWFFVDSLGASAKNEGKMYEEACQWRIDSSGSMPNEIKKIVLKPCLPEAFSKCRLIFSALDASVAGDIESNFCQFGFAVFSNAKNHRMDTDIPILLPYINLDHIRLVFCQNDYLQCKNIEETISRQDGCGSAIDYLNEEGSELRIEAGGNSLHIKDGVSKGFIITNSNCAVSGVSVVLAVVEKLFLDIDFIVVHTMQAVSGAGIPGVPSIDIIDNIIPHIPQEEEKIEAELSKILGSLQKIEGNSKLRYVVKSRNWNVCAYCNRVPVTDGHLATVVLQVSCQKAKNMSCQDLEAAISAALESFKPHPIVHRLPSCPQKVISFSSDPFRPQPRKDRLSGNGMTVSVGGLKIKKLSKSDKGLPVNSENFYVIKMTILIHNTILGAAGSSVLNAELAAALGLIKDTKIWNAAKQCSDSLNCEDKKRKCS